MKYMGSKRTMLANGLGTTLLREARRSAGVVDLFSGSGAVALFLSQRLKKKVIAVDLQAYSSLLAGSVITSTTPFDAAVVWQEWYQKAAPRLAEIRVDSVKSLSVADIERMRAECELEQMPITRAYGGHYFSPTQSQTLDVLLANLPTESPAKTTCHAALIYAASKCAAAPGHTAQPLRPSDSSIPSISAAWRLSVLEQTRAALWKLAPACAKVVGEVHISDANEFAWSQLPKRHLVFVDPPYSAVHYSRFYHVFETIARLSVFAASGSGRYPPPEQRPRSLYSLKGGAASALIELFVALAEAESKCVVTFPAHECSNGLSGDLVAELARPFFEIEERTVRSTFSSLGGTSANHRTVYGRAARKLANELVLVMRPR